MYGAATLRRGLREGVANANRLPATVLLGQEDAVVP